MKMAKILTALLLLLTLHASAESRAAVAPENVTAVSDTLATATAPQEHTSVSGAAKKKVYVFPIREDIMPSAVRLTAKCLEEADRTGADYVVIDMNTYGGLLDAADSIRTMLLNYPRPVFTFVNNQAASAGALIAIASDSIYMRPGASIGAATVVDQSGTPMPDKYQSFMRSMMRSTAEAHGRAAVTNGADTVYRWRRDPLIAEAMVDPSITVPGLVDSTKVVTLTADEAVRWGYSEGTVSSVDELLQAAGIDDYEKYGYEPDWLDRLIGFLTNPTVQAIFIMMIIGGIYFELQTPGIGFPLVVAILGAVLYFAPLYMEGLMAHWELALFVAGLVLIALEIFVTPGFGVLGILGITATVAGLAFAIIDTSLLKYIPTGELSLSVVVAPFTLVICAAGVALLLSIWLGNRFLKGHSRLRKKIVLTSEMPSGEGYVSVAADRGLIGRTGTTSTPLRPAGRVLIDGRYYDAAGDNAAFIEKGRQVTIVRDEGGVLYCREN